MPSCSILLENNTSASGLGPFRPIPPAPVVLVDGVNDQYGASKPPLESRLLPPFAQPPNHPMVSVCFPFVQVRLLELLEACFLDPPTFLLRPVCHSPRTIQLLLAATCLLDAVQVISYFRGGGLH